MDLSSFLPSRLHLLTPPVTSLFCCPPWSCLSFLSFLLCLLSFCLLACESQVATRLVCRTCSTWREGGPEGSSFETISSGKPYELWAYRLFANHCLQWFEITFGKSLFSKPFLFRSKQFSLFFFLCWIKTQPITLSVTVTSPDAFTVGINYVHYTSWVSEVGFLERRGFESRWFIWDWGKQDWVPG